MPQITTEFPEGFESNFTWGGNGQDVVDLPVFSYFDEHQTPTSVSAWKLSPEELAEINRTGVVYLRVLGLHPPVCVVSGLEFEHIANTLRTSPQPQTVFIDILSGEVIGPVDAGKPDTPCAIGVALKISKDEWKVLQ